MPKILVNHVRFKSNQISEERTLPITVQLGFLEPKSCRNQVKLLLLSYNRFINISSFSFHVLLSLFNVRYSTVNQLTIWSTVVKQCPDGTQGFPLEQGCYNTPLLIKISSSKFLIAVPCNDHCFLYVFTLSLRYSDIVELTPYTLDDT